MQWIRQRKTEDPSDFWKDVETRRGGPVRYYSFATLLGRSDGNRVDLPGLLYVVNDTAWFEDFEKDNWLARIMSGTRKFEKTEVSFSVGEVSGVRAVTRRRAAQCLGGGITPDRIPAASALSQFFSVSITAVTLSNGSAIFFDLLKRKEFAALFAGKRA